ncbi:cysteine/glutathione ABC transporter permease/ATP-binding protein CydD [Shewanella intestini]|uniref:Cysteine/glutathione ABC transporter permease/ATP-binding protein CydD n=1 Tax=Shewanella intestini TaxID=2017544 RepID=A0ABS5I553_9GAMM|nr:MULTISPECIES: cysteine/glutathione ABC transporter permease/ATP-binding protein CydD [Shewanella]MBR9729144.1 cysteine/glutathione ABC transporter permease/ATP-binding protein CydD [Shewanella intestini]MRG37285.1 cysteine/glutathione ABC transporter permease/ATP-binding protein CydD [Shewanella sp. XMDDZSB0408]
MDKSLEKSLTQWLKSRQFACGVFLKLSIFLGIVNGLAIVAQAYYLATILDGVIMQHQSVMALQGAFVTLICLFAARALIAYARERVSFEAGKRLRQDIRQTILNKLIELGPVWIKGRPAGAWASIVFEQVEDLHDFYAKYLPQMMLAGFIPLTILVCVFPLNWAAGLILLVTAPLIPMFMILVGMGAADANRKNFTALSRLSGHFMDRLKGLSTLRLFHRGEVELNKVEVASEDFRTRTMSVLRLAFLSSAVLEFFAAVSIAVLAVYFGFSYLGHLNFGHYDLGISLFTGLFILILAPEFYQPLRDLGTHYHAKAQAIGAAESLVELLNTPTPQTKANAEPSNVDIDLSCVSIEAKNLTVYSQDGVCLLGPLSFSIAAKQHVAIVGPSGAGKTSLINALLGFLPYQGELSINGQPLNQISLAQWRQNLAWLGQDPQLFHGSLRDNVALANPQLSDEQVMKLLTQANLGEFVASHAQGLNVSISDQATGVSVGQAQRIALARALGQQASVYVLDEPTASLDLHSEQLVQQALNQAMSGKTCVMITHRIDQLTAMDNIMVLNQGKLVQQGQFDVLANDRSGMFAQLLNDEKETV